MTEKATKSAQTKDAANKTWQTHDVAKVSAPYFRNDTSDGFTIFRKVFCPCGGGCPACQAKTSDLKISQPNDPAEIEADQIADRVMRMSIDETAGNKSNAKARSAPSDTKRAIEASDPKNTIHRKCDACEEKGEMPETVQRKEEFASAAPTQPPADTPPSIRNALRSGGRPLDLQARNFFESRLGYDLSAVRLHTGDAAAESAERLNAHAYSLGSNIVFGGGKYRPDSESGRHLLAHELAHVVQQKTGIVQRAFNSDDDHNLQSERFSGDDRLENIFDASEDQYLRFGSTGDPVTKVQQTLIELGFPLPEFGADGIFGSETSRAVSDFKVQNEISPSDPVVGTRTIGALDEQLVNGGGGVLPAPVPVPPTPVPTCADGPVNMEEEPLPPIPMPIITRMNAQELFAMVKKRQRPGSFVPSQPPLGATIPTIENLKQVTVKTEPIASENCLKCIADWELPQPKVEIFTAAGDFSDEPKRSFPVQEQSVSGCPPESGGTFKDVMKRIMPDAEPVTLDAELEHWSDFVQTHMLITGRYLSNVRRLTPERSHLRGTSLVECVDKVNQFLVETTTTVVPIAVRFYGRLAGEAVDTVYSDSTNKRDQRDHIAESVPPKDKKPIFPNIDHTVNPFTCAAFFRKFDKTAGVNIPGPPFSEIMEDKEGDVPPEQPWNTL